MSRVYAFLLAFGFLTPPPASAQAPFHTGLTGAESGQVVRIRTSQGELLEGRLSASSARNSKLQLVDGDLSVPDAAIDSLWVRGTRTKIGALIGGLVFGAASAITFYELCQIGSEGNGCEETGNVVGLTMAGAAAGAGLGALIGSAVYTWRLQYGRSGLLQVSAVSLDHVGVAVTLPF